MPMLRRAAIAVLILCSSLFAAEGVKINREPVSVEHRKFDRNNPPADMPPLEPQEAAVTKAVFGIGTELSVQGLAEQKRGGKTIQRAKIAGITLNVSLKITIWVPTDAPRTIIDHEEGHRQLSEYFYKDAEKIARTVAQKYLGKIYEEQGNDPQAANQAALNKAIEELSQMYMAQTQNPSVRANVIFDEITQHSRNQKISVEKAVEQSIERAKKEKK
jgi:hypothetical protein